MYLNTKRLIIFIVSLILTFGGVLFIEKYHDQIFEGYQEVVFLDRATLDFKNQIEKIAAENNTVVAKRIVQAESDGSGYSINTYIPIGADSLPSPMIIQTDQELVQNSSDETVYVIISGKLTADQLASLLRDEGNLAFALPMNYSLAYLKTILLRDEIMVLFAVILIALGVLILGQYISELKETGIRRLAGEGKYSIAFQKCSKDVIFMIVITVFLLITLFTVLNLMKIYSRQAFEIVVIPILLWSLIVVVLDIALSNLYYHLLQRQPLVPSIKGKAPLKMIVIAVLLTQFLSLFALLTSAWKLEQSYRILADYEKAKSVWMEYPGYSQMQALFLGEGVLEDELQEFKNNLLQIKGILYRKMNFELTDAQLENRDSYLPNSWMIVNAIWVNAEFLKLNQIELSEHDWKTIEQLGIYDRYILLPESLNDEDGKIKKTWIEIEKTAAEAYRSEENNFSQEITVNTSFYKDTRPVFTFAVFTPYTQSAQKYLYSPIIIVENNNLRYEDPTTVLVPDVEEAEKLIREHKLTAAFGSFTNGLYSINEKIGDTKISQAILAAGAVCSLICSFMLIFLLNLIYFYQGRRQFFIERLAGKSLLEIHRKYLLITSAGCILISLAAVILGAGWKTGVIPLIYCLVLYLLFWLQMKKEQEANILYLKGE